MRIANHSSFFSVSRYSSSIAAPFLKPCGPPFLLQGCGVPVVDSRALPQPVRPAVGDLAGHLRAQTVVDRAFEDGELIVEVLLDALELHPLDLQRSLVLRDRLTREHGRVD